jgi:WD40 repeat protein
MTRRRLALELSALNPLLALALTLSACTPGTVGSEATRTVQQIPSAVETTVKTVPTLTAIPSPTPSPWSQTKLTPGNANQIAQLSLWGRGRVGRVQQINDGGTLVVQTPLGVYVYKRPDATPFLYIEKARIFAISNDEKLLATGFDTGTTKIWDLESSQVVQTITHHEADYLLPSMVTGKNREQWLSILDLHDIQAMTFAPDDAELAIGYSDGYIETWKPGGDGPSLSIKSGFITAPPQAIRFSPDKTRIIVISGISYPDPQTRREISMNERITFWDTSDASLVGYLNDPGDFASKPFLTDGKTLITTGAGYIRLWDIETGKETRHIGTNMEIGDLSYSADESRITITGTMNGKLVRQTRRFPAGSLIEQEAFAPAPASTEIEDFLFAAGHYPSLTGVGAVGDQALRAWGPIPSGAYWWDIPGNQVTKIDLADVQNPTFHPADESIAWCQKGIVYIRSSDGKIEPIDFPTHKQCEGVALSPRKDYVAVWTGTRISVLKLSSFDSWDLVGQRRNVNVISFSDDGSLVASGSFAPQGGSSEITFWQTGSADMISRPNRLDRTDILHIVISPDNTFAISVGDKLRIWNIADGRNLINIDALATCAALSPDGTLLASGGYNGTLHIWSTSDGAEIASIDAHRDKISDITFTPDGAGIVTVSLDGTLRVWGIR